MSEVDDDALLPGRPVRLSANPPGFWLMLIGVALAILGPLFGFLIGSVLGAGDDDQVVSPLYWGLFIGFVVAGIGVLLTVIGGLRLWRVSRSREEPSNDPDEVGASV